MPRNSQPMPIQIASSSSDCTALRKHSRPSSTQMAPLMNASTRIAVLAWVPNAATSWTMPMTSR